MIQELLGGGSVPNGLLSERKNSIPFTSSSTCPSSTPILTTTITTSPSTASLTNAISSSNNNNTNTNTNNTNSEANPSQQNLRCPRCDSTNTKFCYYNNYNLTQPRHFCKTCRRYWTKGGTLRNVPIGGGCRKNKTITANNSSSSSGFVKPSPNAMAKAKATLSSELLINGNPGNFLGSGLFDPELHSNYPNPIFWSSLPQNSHILSLLRGSNSTQFQNPNPNPNPNPIFGIKTESGLGLDSYGNGAPSNLHGSFSRGNQNHINGLFSSGVQDFIQNNGNNNNNNNNSNILELYQRLKSSSNYSYCSNDNPGNTVILGNMVGSSSSSSALSSPMHSTILDSAPIGGGDNNHFGGYHGLMNSPALISGWSDFPTVPININGAYP